MKRLAISALFVSLLVGSVAMAGQGYRGNTNGDHGDRHSDNRDHGDHNRGNWNGGHNDNNRGHDRRDRNRGNDRHDFNRGNDHRDWNRGHDRHDWNRGNDRRDWNRGHDRHDWNRGNDRRDWNRGRHWSAPRHYAPPRYYAPQRGRYYYGAYHRPYGYYSHSWSRGERLPRAYYERSYVVYDYDRCGLRAPPYGYHWVRVDQDVVLAAVATGVILDVIYNQFG